MRFLKIGAPNVQDLISSCPSQKTGGLKKKKLTLWYRQTWLENPPLSNR